jgi:hypothetical protein
LEFSCTYLCFIFKQMEHDGPVFFVFFLSRIWFGEQGLVWAFVPVGFVPIGVGVVIGGLREYAGFRRFRNLGGRASYGFLWVLLVPQDVVCWHQASDVHSVKSVRFALFAV